MTRGDARVACAPHQYSLGDTWQVLHSFISSFGIVGQLAHQSETEVFEQYATPPPPPPYPPPRADVVIHLPRMAGISFAGGRSSAPRPRPSAPPHRARTPSRSCGSSCRRSRSPPSAQSFQRGRSSRMSIKLSSATRWLGAACMGRASSARRYQMRAPLSSSTTPPRCVISIDLLRSPRISHR